MRTRRIKMWFRRFLFLKRTAIKKGDGEQGALDDGITIQQDIEWLMEKLASHALILANDSTHFFCLVTNPVVQGASPNEDAVRILFR